MFNTVERIAPVLLVDSVVILIVNVPSLPFVWSNCSHDIAELLILHWSSQVIFNADSPPAPAKLISFSETDSTGSTDAFWWQYTKENINRKSVTILKEVLMFISILLLMFNFFTD